MRLDRDVGADQGHGLGVGEFATVARLVHAEAGIVLESHKRAMVQGRLARRLRALGIGDFPSYVDRVERDPAERGRMIDEITTNHTGFFREVHHFQHLAQQALPELMARAFAGGRVRIWSAGCASGEEPFSIALVVADAGRLFGGRWLDRADLAILATDISESALHAAKEGVYQAEALEAVPEALTADAVERLGDGTIRLHGAVRDFVTFRSLNLLHEWPMRGPFDIIFCRNVFIYFDEPTKDRLYSRLVEMLAPSGWLYIGHSERVTGPAAAKLRLVGQTIYRRLGDAA